MTVKQHPEALQLAERISDVLCTSEEDAKAIAAAADELVRLHSENETLRVERERNLDSINVNNEIINKIRDENETLQAGYDAARLEIESLQARIKTMAEEHADELTMAHLDGRMRAAQPAGSANTRAQENVALLADILNRRPAMNAGLTQAYAAWTAEVYDLMGAMAAEPANDSDSALRASHGQAPAQAAPAAVEGCTRSHPHENMDSACRAKAAIAEMQNMAARGAEATAHDLDRFVAMLAAAPITQPAPQQGPDEINSYIAARAWVASAAQEGNP